MSKTPDDWLAENEDRLGDAIDIPGPDPAFRTRLLDATAGQIRFRRQRRVWTQAAAIVIAFLSGMFVMSGLRSAERQPEQVAKRTEFTLDTQQATAPLPNVTAPASTGNEAPEPEFRYALLADPEAFTLRYQSADTDERLRLLRAAGDYYFFQEGNVDLAAKFYRQYIELADAENRERPYDSSNWLLAAMSLNPQEELQNEHEI